MTILDFTRQRDTDSMPQESLSRMQHPEKINPFSSAHVVSKSDVSSGPSGGMRECSDRLVLRRQSLSPPGSGYWMPHVLLNMARSPHFLGGPFLIDDLTFVFTDLRDSIRLYREIGDVSALKLVINHFELLRTVIDEEGGVLIKTMGDASMSVFEHPYTALQAMIRAQQLARLGKILPYPFCLKTAIHSGPCLAVRQKDAVDFYGSTVNITARLVSLSQGEEVIISESVYRDPQVGAILRELEDSFCVESENWRLRGFGKSHFEIWRVYLHGESPGG